MRGNVHLIVQSVRLKYEMEFSRNLTILKGDSATGKTTLVDMIQEYNLNGSDTGINLSCSCPCRVISGNTWVDQLKSIQGSLVFIDEGNKFVSSKDFAGAISGTDNYYVIVTRESLFNLPYSVTEIYGIHSSGKYAYQEPVYHHMYRIYGDYQHGFGGKEWKKILVEDSNAGYDFFSGVAQNVDVECISAHGAGNLYAMLRNAAVKEGTVVIADGAAFGPHMEKVFHIMLRNSAIRLYLPESFEWLILSSGILNDNEITDILDHSSDYIDSSEYFSWERFFTSLLINRTMNSYLKYSKSKLNPVYLHARIRDRILAAFPSELRKRLQSIASNLYI